MKDRNVAPGIWRTRYGWRVFARVKGRLYPHRIKDREHRLGLVELKAERDAWKVEVRKTLGLPKPSPPGTFAADVREKYLPTVIGMPSYNDRVYHMDLWIAEVGARPSNGVQSYEVAAVRERWRQQGPKRIWTTWPVGEKPADCKTGKQVYIDAPLSISQVNLRMRALENFYSTMNGPYGYNPAREAGELDPLQPRPRALEYGLIEEILSKMPDRGRPHDGERSDVSLTKLRLRAIAYTGFSHKELGDIGVDDLHLDASSPWVWIAGRQKGQGTDGGAQPLTSRGADALRALAAARGLGPFSRSSMWKSWARACAKVEGLSPPYPSPYVLRHSYATEFLRKTSDLKATQLNMRHRSDRTTRIYAELAIDQARIDAVQTAEARGAFEAKKIPPKLPPPQKKRAKPARKRR